MRCLSTHSCIDSTFFLASLGLHIFSGCQTAVSTSGPSGFYTAATLCVAL